MPSPNGYLTGFSYTVHDRQSFRVTVTHDIDNPPWLPGQAGSYTLVWETGPTAAGPWTPAPMTDLGTGCTPTGTNETTLNGGASSIYRIGDPTPGTGFTEDTDYFVRVTILDPSDVQVDQWVLDNPAHTLPYQTFAPLNSGQTTTTADVLLGGSGGFVNISPPCNQDTVVWDIATTPGGPYTSTAPVAATQSPSHTFTGLTPGTTYYWRARVSEQSQTAGVYYTSPEQTFTTEDEPVTTPPFDPQPCAAGDGPGGGPDVEQTLLCDVMPDGQVAGTALAVYEYDADGNPAGPPTFVNPGTGDPYVAQGVLQPCPGDVGCAPPQQFCFTTTTTGPVEHPGRTYDITLPINPGFAVDSLQIDATNYPANLTWAVTDADGEQFRAALQSFLAARFPNETVTVTNPNAGTPVCGLAIPMTVHIECARIDTGAPDLVELIYNGGRDLVVNPAYLTTPPTNLNGPQFVYLQRQDAGGTLNCTSIANQGWETNDLGPNNTRDFELWGQGPGGLQTTEGATPTPRGTPIQEITADINDTGTGPTIWQTFTVPAGGTFRAVLVHGARDNGEQHRITLSTGDTNDNQVGDIINNVTNPPQVTNAGGGTPGPWTSFSQDVALGAGVYTFAISTTNPVGANRGGLFTDMRVFQDSPDQHAAAVTDDETCTVTTNETVTTTTCEYWQPRCSNGEITAWVNVADGEELSNAAFWGQAPAPRCCTSDGGDGGGGTVTPGNLIHNYDVCGVVGGIPQTLQRVVITDQSGGVVGQTFVGSDGGPVTPTSYTIGGCGGDVPVVGEFVLCDDNGPFIRKLIQNAQGLVTSVVNVNLAGSPYVPVGDVAACQSARDTELVELCDVQGSGAVVPYVLRMTFDENGALITSEAIDGAGNPYTPTGTTTVCSQADISQEILCDEGNGGQEFIRFYVRTGGILASVQNTELDGTTPYVPVGPVVACGGADVDRDREVVCWTQTSTGATVHTGTIRHDDTLPAPGWILFDQHQTPVSPAEPGLTFVPCGATSPDQDLTVLCDVNAGVPTPFVRDYQRDATGAVTGVSNYTLAGAAYTPTGTVGLCAAATGRDEEILVLCDSATPTPNRFLRRYNYDAATGALISVVNTTLDGSTAFAPVGAVTVCAQTVQADTDFVEEILCDSNGTAFIRLFRFNSTTGVLVSTTNTTLAGAAFTPVGTVGVCADCCPVVIGEGCTNTGSGRYTAIRAANGTITLIDSVSGATVTAANIVACPDDDTVVTLSAQARTLTNAAPWTPGTDVTGTLTSLTVTGTSGLWDLVDANGTALTGLPAGLTLTWNAEDSNILTGPTSVTPQAGSTVIANWTQK